MCCNETPLFQDNSFLKSTKHWIIHGKLGRYVWKAAIKHYSFIYYDWFKKSSRDFCFTRPDINAIQFFVRSKCDFTKTLEPKATCCHYSTEILALESKINTCYYNFVKCSTIGKEWHGKSEENYPVFEFSNFKQNWCQIKYKVSKCSYVDRLLQKLC